MAETLKFSDIDVDLTKLGQGGQGTVYRAPKVSTSFAKSMVFKQYHDGTGGKPNILGTVNVGALKAMPDFLECLAYRDGARLIEIAAWPCRIVEDRGRVTGFVMPSIPDEFFIDLYTAKGSSRVMAEFQHILNDPQIVAMRLNGRIITDREKYELLHSAASALAFLHSHNVCVGDISPKNLLFSLSGRPAVYFIDCDAMRVHGVSLSDQLATPGWEVPPGEERATPYSDRFKFGLLALRLILGDQDARDPSRLPPSVPTELRKIITETLTQSPQNRPEWSWWETTLESAAKQAPVQSSTGPIPTPQNKIRPQPRRGARRSQQPPTPPPPAPSPPRPQQQASPPQPVHPTANSGNQAGVWLGSIAAAVVLVVVLFVVIGAVEGAFSDSGTSSGTSTKADLPTYSPPPPRGTAPTRAVPSGTGLTPKEQQFANKVANMGYTSPKGPRGLVEVGYHFCNLLSRGKTMEFVQNRAYAEFSGGGPAEAKVILGYALKYLCP